MNVIVTESNGERLAISLNKKGYLQNARLSLLPQMKK